MDRRHFLKVVPAIAAGLSISPLKSSIMLTWSYPGTTNRHGVATWNTPTKEAFDESLWECVVMHCRLACGGYDVEYREFNVLRFVSANAKVSA